MTSHQSLSDMTLDLYLHTFILSCRGMADNSNTPLCLMPGTIFIPNFVDKWFNHRSDKFRFHGHLYMIQVTNIQMRLTSCSKWGECRECRRNTWKIPVAMKTSMYVKTSPQLSRNAMACCQAWSEYQLNMIWLPRTIGVLMCDAPFKRNF